MRTKELWQQRGLAMHIAAGIVVIHVAALVLGIWFFSWQGLAVFGVLALLTGMVGVTTGYHRLLTHQSFKTYRPIRWLLAFIGQLSGQGPVFKWVADHRVHHTYSDEDGDPHSPVLYGFWHSHVGWTMLGITPAHLQQLYADNVRDLQKDRVMTFINRMYGPMIVVSFACLLLLGWALGGWRLGLSFVAWGGFVRLVYVYHITWFVNSATHVWGYRNYETTDNSRNLWWVGILAFGEGWHNNHHASQVTAYHGHHQWWELDPTYWLICLLELLGLAWDVQRKVAVPKLPAS